MLKCLLWGKNVFLCVLLGGKTCLKVPYWLGKHTKVLHWVIKMHLIASWLGKSGLFGTKNAVGCLLGSDSMHQSILLKGKACL